jgi:hypothetical protein
VGSTPAKLEAKSRDSSTRFASQDVILVNQAPVLLKVALLQRPRVSKADRHTL